MTFADPFSPESASDLVGRPFAFGARGASGPLGCWGVVVEVLGRAGVRVSDPLAGLEPGSSAEEREAARRGYAEIMAGRSEWSEVAPPPRPGDVALFGSPSGVEHAGICLSGGMFLHAIEKVGVACVPWMRVRDKAVAIVRHRDLAGAAP